MEKEVEVGKAVELLIQVQGQEGEDIVLGRVDDVLLEESWCGGLACPALTWPPPTCPSSHEQREQSPYWVQAW